MISAGLYVFVLRSFREPHGQWDAWAIWNVHARVLFRAGTDWQSFYSHIISNYPLLLPSCVARVWTYGRSDALAGPALMAFLFSAACVGLLFAALSAFRHTTAARLSLLALLGTPFFLLHGASQYADIPLAFFFLSAVVLLALHEETSNAVFLPLAGLAAAMAGWTKNEGLFFLAVTAIALILKRLMQKKIKPLTKEMLLFVAGALPVLALILFFKTAFLFDKGSPFIKPAASLAETLLDLSRHVLVIKALTMKILTLGKGWVGVPVLLIAYVAAKRSFAPSWLWLFPTGMIAGYYFVFVTTPYDLTWLLDLSLERLLIQLWPMALFVYFMSVERAEGKHD